ncbi:MAG: GntP family permease [Synergistetes bacterium]|nr:GntP family permease [Synergistota bacterium]MCX8128402.1 GntP family permease [Synergistota bacterium]MDW8192437.1 SLC13 family permease [Synergistota bacterium]
MLVFHLVVAIAIALILIIRYRWSPVFGLILGALYFGIASGQGALKTASTIASGFGTTMTGIGLVVGFGVIIGQLLADSGAVESIVRSLLRVFSPKRTPEALCSASLIVSTPVFFDVGFIILAPIARRIAKVTSGSVPLLLSSLIIGLGTAHMLIPPTPGPLVVADTLKVPLGKMILGGFLVGAPGAFLALYIYKFITQVKGFWNTSEDEDVFFKDVSYEETTKGKLPSLALSLLPIVTPIVLILLASLVRVIAGKEPGPFGSFLLFIGDRNIAMLLGAMCALYVGYTTMDRESLSKSVDKALASAGIVLLITGAGGSLGAVLGGSNIGKVLAEAMKVYQIPILFLAWIIASVIKIAQGSGTVAIITTANLMAPLISQLNVPGLWLALAIGSGALLGCHINDSGFWVVAKVSGLTTKGGFKTYTLATAINAVTTLVMILVFMAIF